MAITVVVSHYVQRGTDNLINLLNQLFRNDPGLSYDLTIVCNLEKSDVHASQQIILNLKRVLGLSIASSENSTPSFLPNTITAGTRPNTGMNIGAWDWGWRINKCSSEFLFLQDEVVLNSSNWLAQFHEKLCSVTKSHHTQLGLIGESWNYRWDHAWDILGKSALNRPPAGTASNPFMDKGTGRVDRIRDTLLTWHIPEGSSGGHLRSLVWYTNQESLAAIGGFHIGSDFDGCVAAEIAVSRHIASLGGACCQLRERPFSVFWHPEWRRDGLSKRSIQPLQS